MNHILDNLFVFRDTDLITIIRVAFSFLLGGVIGYERESRERPAGLRTHMLLCAGCTCFTVASIYGFQAYGQTDPARLAAQIITGIGFLGAGAIIRTGSNVRGLTSAASVWVTSSIGVIAGLGMLWLALFTTAATWIALRVIKHVEETRRRRSASPHNIEHIPTSYLDHELTE